MPKPDCYQCKHRGTIPYDYHSRCNHPTGLITVKGNPHGIKEGWFNHPFNFDPLWLIECDGFTEIKSQEEINGEKGMTQGPDGRWY